MQNKGFTMKVWLPEPMTHDRTRDQGQVAMPRCISGDYLPLVPVIRGQTQSLSLLAALKLGTSVTCSCIPYLIIDIGRTWAEIRNTEFRKK